MGREYEKLAQRGKDLYFMHTRIFDLIHNSRNANPNCRPVSHWPDWWWEMYKLTAWIRVWRHRRAHACARTPTPTYPPKHTHTCWYAKSWHHWLILCKLKWTDLTSPNFGDLLSGFICTSTQSGVNKIVHCHIISNSRRKIVYVVNNSCVDQQGTSYLSYNKII